MSDNGVASWIPDGYTESVYFESVEKLYGAIRFTYRPILITTLARINREMNEAGDDDAKRQYIAAKWMTQRLVSWDLKKPNGEAVDMRNIEDVLKVRPALFTRLWNCIGLGIDGGDIDPKWRAQELHERAQREMAVTMSGKEGHEVDEGN
jgi:hypothetical protein